MKSVVLCPGPSLAAMTAWPNCLTIGVNRAPLIVRNLGKVDWWVFTDPRVAVKYAPDYAPRIFTSADSRDKLRLPNALTYEQVGTPRECTYTATAALMLAAHLGATQIDVFGADMTGTADADGHEYDFHDEPAKVTRTPERWNGEAEIWQRVADSLAERGITVRRIIPCQASTTH